MFTKREKTGLSKKFEEYDLYLWAPDLKRIWVFIAAFLLDMTLFVA
jgi:hypothetical protein